MLWAAEAVDDAGLETEVILVGAAKPGVKIVSLDEADGQISLPLVVDSAAKGHSKGVIRKIAADVHAAKQSLTKRLEAAIATVGHPRPEEVRKGMDARAANSSPFAPPEFTNLA